MQSIADCERVRLSSAGTQNRPMSSKIPPITTRNSEIHHGSWLKSWFKSWQMNNQNFMVHLIYNPNKDDFVCQIMAIQWIVWYPNVGDPHCCSSCCVRSLSARAAWPDGALLWENIHRWWLNWIPVFNDFVCVRILWKLYLLSAKLLCAKHDITKLRNYNIINVTCPSYDIPKICMYKYNCRVCICFWVSQQNKHHFLFPDIAWCISIDKRERERVGKNAGPMSTPHSYMTLEVGSTWVHTHPHWM